MCWVQLRDESLEYRLEYIQISPNKMRKCAGLETSEAKFSILQKYPMLLNCGFRGALEMPSRDEYKLVDCADGAVSRHHSIKEETWTSREVASGYRRLFRLDLRSNLDRARQQST